MQASLEEALSKHEQAQLLERSAEGKAELLQDKLQQFKADNDALVAAKMKLQDEVHEVRWRKGKGVTDIPKQPCAKVCRQACKLAFGSACVCLCEYG